LILLDTNVLSALMQRLPDPVATAWLDTQPVESMWTTSITVLEIQTGLELLGPGRRRRRLKEAFEVLLGEDLAGRVQAFDRSAALAAAGIAASRQRSGRGVEIRDVQIAGIAVSRRAAIASRNVRRFDDLPVAVIDPWSPAA
jgi:predicted nucleic acid-binding protein